MSIKSEHFTSIYDLTVSNFFFGMAINKFDKKTNSIVLNNEAQSNQVLIFCYFDWHTEGR